MKRPPADPAAFQEAVRWFRDRLPMTDDAFDALDAQAYHKAFRVAGLAQLDMVTQVWEALDRAIAKGESMESFRAAVQDRLTAAWGKEMPWRVETIFRTNAQLAYSDARWEQMEHPAVKKARPFRRFDAIMDSRTTDICAALDGTVLPADDPFWGTHLPPLHFNCRSHQVSLTGREAEAEGIDDAAPEEQPTEGFGRAPTLRPPEPEPDLGGYPPALAAEYRRAA